MTAPGSEGDRLPVVPFVPFRCPKCRATKPATYGSTGRLRYHRCKHCGTKFRSLELQPEDVARPAGRQAAGASLPAGGAGGQFTDGLAGSSIAARPSSRRPNRA